MNDPRWQQHVKLRPHVEGRRTEEAVHGKESHWVHPVRDL